MTSTQKLWAYLEPILQTTEALKILLSDAERMDRLIEASRSEEVYPAIFVMRPKYSGKVFDGAALVAMFQLTFFVLCQGKLDDYDSQDAAYQQAEEMTELIVQTLQHDSRTYKCYFDFNGFQAEPVIYTMVDATYGYEVRLKLGIQVNEQFC